MTALTEWENFYVIVGSSAGALIGLQFVVITLIVRRPPLRAAESGVAFATPTIVHFGVAPFQSAIISASWSGIILRIARYMEPFALLVAQLAYDGEEGPELAYRFQ
jgi:hypothetical protein